MINFLCYSYMTNKYERKLKKYKTKLNKSQYPSYTYHITREKFEALVRNVKTVIINESLNLPNLEKYLGNYLLLQEDWHKNEELNNITDCFTEECRIKCKFGKYPSPLEYWQSNKLNLFKITSDPRKLRELLYSQTKLCNNFRISVALSILQIFHAKKWLDISAGWGDRLIAAIAYNVDRYVSVDPNPCLFKGYKQIIDTLASNKQKYTIIQGGFEQVTLPDEKFDLVFSSPPFFDLEDYSNSQDDSLHKYKQKDEWYNKFLIPSLDKAYNYLELGGHLVLYMGEGIKTNYISEMIAHVSAKMKYEGIIYYYYPDKMIPRAMYVWIKN